MINWSPMVEVVPEGEHGDAKVEHFEVDKKASDFTRLRSMLNPGRDEFVPPGRYARLIVAGSLVMSDTQAEKMSNLDVVFAAHGRVFIGGLGLGMILCPILKNPKVEAVTVVERSAGVVELVGRRAKLPNKDKLTIIEADLLDWRPPKGASWEVIYFDIWADINPDSLDDIATLKRRFARRLNRSDPDSWMGAWREEHLRYVQRSRRRRDCRHAIGGPL